MLEFGSGERELTNIGTPDFLGFNKCAVLEKDTHRHQSVDAGASVSHPDFLHLKFSGTSA